MAIHSYFRMDWPTSFPKATPTARHLVIRKLTPMVILIDSRKVTHSAIHSAMLIGFRTEIQTGWRIRIHWHFQKETLTDSCWDSQTATRSVIG